LFQSLLYQVATAALSPADIAEPIRAILRRQRYATVLERVIGINPSARRVKRRSGAVRNYDFLVLATGSAGTDPQPRHFAVNIAAATGRLNKIFRPQNHHAVIQTLPATSSSEDDPRSLRFSNGF
jgi:NADH dehydrogenase FAD-containing subunit